MYGFRLLYRCCKCGRLADDDLFSLKLCDSCYEGEDENYDDVDEDYARELEFKTSGKNDGNTCDF